MVITYNTLMNLYSALDEYFMTNNIKLDDMSKQDLVDCKLANTLEDAKDIKKHNTSKHILFYIIFKHYYWLKPVYEFLGKEHSHYRCRLKGYTTKDKWKDFKSKVKCKLKHL